MWVLFFATKKGKKDFFQTKRPQKSKTIFYSTFRLMRKPSSGRNEMLQLEGKNKDAILRHSHCIVSYTPKLYPCFFLLTVAFHLFLMMAYA